MSVFQSLCDISCLSKLHAHHFLFVIQVLALGASDFEGDEVVEIVADFLDIEVGRVDFDFQGEYPGTEYFDCVHYLGGVLLV